MNIPPRIRTFRHRFKGGITCELVVDLDRLAAKETGCPALRVERTTKASRQSPNTAAGFSQYGNTSLTRPGSRQ